MLSFDKIRDYVREKIPYSTLTRILFLLFIIMGFWSGYNIGNKITAYECNEFIIENYKIPELEALGYDVSEDRIVSKKAIMNDSWMWNDG